MSARDRRLAEKYAAEGRISASEKAKRKEQARDSRGQVSSGTDRMGVMRRLASTPRDAASRDRARGHQRSTADGSGGESFADRDAPSTTKWSWRR